MDFIRICGKARARILLLWSMNLISSINTRLGSGKGLLLFLLGLTLIWVSGYYLIDFIYTDEWTRYLRQLYFSRFTLTVALLCLISASIPHLKNFISNTKKTATDLAVFRILFFGFFAFGLFINPSAISDLVLPFLNLPESAQVSMPFMGWYPKVVPINETLVSAASILFYISIFTSLFGFKTRWSIVIFTLTLFYLFAIPNLYGKVNHNHHLIWFPAILAFSPCDDRFSLDAYFRRRSNKVIHHSSKSYSLPFLLIWILIGLIYFFPGFWKMWTNGLDWALTDNVRNQMYFKWKELGSWWSWTPIFRIDHYPLLFKSSGLYTLIFELFFIPLLLNKSTRKLAIALGIGFHLGTLLFMNIFFVVLVWSYLSFVNWNSIPFLTEKGNMSSLKQSYRSYSLTKWIGITLITSGILFGFGKWDSWPFTVYPTFDSMIEEESNELQFSGISKDGKTIELDKEVLYTTFSSERYWSLEYESIKDSKENKLDTALLNQFVSIYAQQYDSLKEVTIYIVKESIVPERRLRNPRFILYSQECN